MKKLLTFLIILVILSLGIYYFWPRKKNKTPQGPPPTMKVITYTIKPSQLIVNLDTTGTLTAYETTTIRNEVPGKIELEPLQEGSFVQKGDLLLQINDTDYQQEVERKKAAYELAEMTFKRQEELAKAGATTQQIKDESYTSQMIKKAEYESAKIQLERTKIYAPYDGTLGFTTLSLGEYLTVGSPIISITAINPILVQFPISQTFYPQLKTNSPISVSLDAWPGKKFPGTIYAIDPQIDIETRSINVKAEVKNDEELLRPGMFVYVSVPILSKEDSILVPEEALIPSADKTNVMKIVDGKAQLAKVTTGIRQNDFVEITSGLTPGDVIVRSGQLKVHENMPVEPIAEESPPTVHETTSAIPETYPA